MKKPFFGLPKNIFFLGLTSLFNDFSSEMIFAIFPAFFTSVLKAGAQSLGFVDGIAEAASNLFKIYSGNLSDRFQKRKLLVVLGYSLSVITRPLYLLAGTVSGVLGLRFLDRVGKGFRDAPRDAIISLSVPPEDLGRAFGYHRAMDTTGAILGPLVAYIILRFLPLHFNTVFLVAFVVGIIALLTLVFIKDVVVPNVRQRTHVLESFSRLPLHFKWYLLAVFILSIGSLPVAVLLLKTQSLGLIIADIPLFYMLYNIPYAGFSMSAGTVSDRMGTRVVIILGYIILLGSYFVLSVATTTWVLIGGFLLLGLFPALTDGVQRSFASKLTTEDTRGGALGWLNAANGFGALLAGIGGGFLWQTYSATTALVIASLVVAIGLFVFIVSAPKKSL